MTSHGATVMAIRQEVADVPAGMAKRTPSSGMCRYSFRVFFRVEVAGAGVRLLNHDGRVVVVAELRRLAGSQDRIPAEPRLVAEPVEGAEDLGGPAPLGRPVGGADETDRPNPA